MIQLNNIKKAIFVGPDAEQLVRNMCPRFIQGHVFPFDWTKMKSSYTIKEIKQMVFKELKSQNIDTIFLKMDYDPLFYGAEIIRLREIARVIGVFVDDAFLPYFSSEAARLTDITLTSDPLQIPRYGSLGINAITHLLTIDLEMFKNLQQERDVDLLLYGSSLKGRSEDIEFIHRKFKDLKIVDIINRKVPVDELVKLLNRSKITINWTWPIQETLVNNFRDISSRHYTQLKARIFEAILCGCVPISTPAFVHEKIFENLIPTFQNTLELERLVKLLVTDYQEWQKVSSSLSNCVDGFISEVEESFSSTIDATRIHSTFSSTYVDEVVATYRVYDLIGFLLQGRFLSFFKDAIYLKATKVQWKFIYREYFCLLKVKFSSWF